MKNQDKATANYAKRFTKRKSRLTNAKPEETEDSSNGTLTKCKFCEKEHRLNDCWHSQAECHYCHDTGHIAKFCKKNAATRTSSKNIVIYARSLLFSTRQIPSPVLASCTLKAIPLDSSVQRVIIDSRATDHFFANRAYFSTYEEYHLEFQTGSRQILSAYGYSDVILRLAHSDSSEMIWAIKKVSWAPSLGHNLLSTISLSKNGVKYFCPNFRYFLKSANNRALWCS